MQNSSNTEIAEEKISEDNTSLRNIIEEDLIQRIKGLSSEELLNVYRSLSGLKTESNNNLGRVLYDEKFMMDLKTSIEQVKELTQILIEQLKGEGLNLDIF